MAKKILTLLLALLMVLSCFACGVDDTPSDGTTDPDDAETTPPANVEVKLTGDVNYTIIRSEDADDGTNNCASDLWKYLQETTGKILVMIDSDWVQKAEQADNDKPEILIGLTNRPESEAASKTLTAYRDYTVSVSENKIAIFANTAEHLAEAIEYFKSGLTFADGVLTYSGPQNYIKKYENYKYSSANLCGKDIASYSIVIPKEASAADKTFAENLALTIALDTGYLPEIKDDTAAASNAEIVIGKTNRAASVTDEGAEFKRDSYLFRTADGAVTCIAGNMAGYRSIMAEFDKLMTEGKGTLSGGVDKQYQSEFESLDGKRVAFIGNSQTYFGNCVIKNGDFLSYDTGYFYQICKGFGENVTVRNCTIGGAGFRSLRENLIKNYPNYYNNPDGKEMNDFYNQDYVIFQQEGSSVATTYTALLALMEMFPPTTQFFFFVGDIDVRWPIQVTIDAAKRARDENGVYYLPVGHILDDLCDGRVKIEGSTIKYSRNSFAIDRIDTKNRHDTWHPNWLNGYITALTTYAAITGTSAVGVDYSFVSRDQRYYTNGATSNFTQILDSPTDMLGIQQLIDEYLVKYNP